MTQVDLQTLLAQAGELFAPLAADNGITIIVETSAEYRVISADRARLMQVLQNLIANALRKQRSARTLSPMD